MAGPLNQSDIDRLVAEAAGSSASVIFRSDGERFPNPKQISARAFDFRTPIHLAEADRAVPPAVGGERGEHVFRDLAAIEEQPADQRRLTVVDRAAGEHTQRVARRHQK